MSETEDFVKVLPIVAQDQQVTGTDRNGTYNYAYGQSGFSVHMVQKQDQSVSNNLNQKRYVGNTCCVSHRKK